MCNFFIELRLLNIDRMIIFLLYLFYVYYIYCYLLCCNLRFNYLFNSLFIKFDSCILTLFNLSFSYVEKCYFIILYNGSVISHMFRKSVLTLFNDVTGRGNNGTCVGTYRNWEVSKLRGTSWKSIKTNCIRKDNYRRNFSERSVHFFYCSFLIYSLIPHS